MKQLLFLLIISTLLMTCSKKEPLPEDVWQEGCIELGPYQGGYRINGICCTYITFPQVDLHGDRNFVVNGTYSTFTGAGFADSPLVITGQLLADGTLAITYTVNQYSPAPTKHTFKPGRATTTCQCGCD